MIVRVFIIQILQGATNPKKSFYTFAAMAKSSTLSYNGSKIRDKLSSDRIQKNPPSLFQKSLLLRLISHPIHSFDEKIDLETMNSNDHNK